MQMTIDPAAGVENALFMNVIFSEPGAALATLLHTAGAIVYLGGIIAYVSWARTIRRGEHNANILALGASLAYMGIAANLLGGFLRTYQPGHPSLFAFGASSWATVMVLKHLALVAGMLFAVYLFEIVAPRLRKARKEGVLEPNDSRGRASAAIVVVSILVASVLGAVTTVLDVSASGAGSADDGMGGGHDPVSTQPFSGALHPSSGSVGLNSPATGGFDVPALATAIEAVLQGQGAPFLGSPFQFTLTLTAPDGERFSGTSPMEPNEPRTVRLEIPDLAAGRWTYEVSATAPAPYELLITVFGQASNIMQNTVVVSASGIYEINLEMEENETLYWEWTSVDPLEFNLHTHFDGEVQYKIEETTDKHEGNYTTRRAGGHSLMWETSGNSDIGLTYKVWGNFTLESIYD